MTQADAKTPLYDQFDGAGNPQTDEAQAALRDYFLAAETAASMTGGAALNGWSGVSDPRERPRKANHSAEVVQTPQAEAWDTSIPNVNFIE